MALSNLGFESPGATAADASGWTYQEVSTAESRCIFGPSNALEEVEAFARTWTGIDGYVFTLVMIVNALPADFDSSFTTQALEDFAEGWSGTEDYEFVLASVEEVDFSTEGPEHFTEGWGTYHSTMPSVEDAPLEAFAEEWLGIDGYLFDHTSLSEAVFDDQYEDSSTSSEVEDFAELAYEELLAHGEDYGGANRVRTSQPHLMAVGARMFFRVEAGILPAPLSEGVPYYNAGGDVDLMSLCIDPGLLTSVTLTTLGQGYWFVQADPRRYWLLPAPA